MNKKSAYQWIPAAILVSGLAAVSGCGGSGSSGPPPEYSVGGSVAGLASGESLVLLDNGGSATTLAANGPFTFGLTLTSGSSYAVTISTQPPGQTCSVARGAGTVGSQAVANVAVTCTTNSHTIGGTISRLGDATGLVLANGIDTLTVPPNATSFTMPTAVLVGSAYDITVQAHPTALNCAVISGTGTVPDANVTSVSISCQQGTASVLYSFAGGATDGSQPYGGLVRANDGNFYGLTYSGGASNDGVVFKITPGGTETVLYSFAGAPADGANPFGSLIQASGGSFYGMTSAGGASNDGVVFRITASGTETVLYSFAGGADGSQPGGSLIQASDGNFYGMTAAGGTGNNGTVFKIAPGGTETVLHVFAGTADGSDPEYASLVQASDGNFYGTTTSGGTDNDGVVFRITPAGTEAILYSFAGGTADGAYPATGLTQGSDGDFYGSTYVGGATNYGVIYRVTPGGTETVLHSFAGQPTDGANPFGSLIQASDGNFYGVTPIGGGIGGVVYEITPQGTESVIYFFTGGTTDGAQPSGNLIQTSDGDLYGVTYEAGAYGVGTVFALN